MILIYSKDFKILQITIFECALAGQIQHMAAQKVGFTPRPISYGPPKWHVSSSAISESQVRAELEMCQLRGPYFGSMQKPNPVWAVSVGNLFGNSGAPPHCWLLLLLLCRLMGRS